MFDTESIGLLINLAQRLSSDEIQDNISGR